jgi:hypothetical protein
MQPTERLRQSTALTRAERNAFSGIGAIVCNAGGRRTTSTAFLVGGFDIAVTVAHTFERNGHWAMPSQCIYTSIAAAGEVYERIPLLSFQTQWQVQPETFGEPTADLAVARLRDPVRLAYRTMSLTQFEYDQAPVVLVGFPGDLVIDPRKRKSHGSVYERRGKGCVRFAHDVDSRNLTPGAPLIDVRDGVVLGLHTRLEGRRVKFARHCRERGNGMIPMNDWLKHTIRAEIGSPPSPETGKAAAAGQ